MLWQKIRVLFEIHSPIATVSTVCGILNMKQIFFIPPRTEFVPKIGKEKFHQKFGGGPNKGASSRQRKRSGSGTRVGNWTDKLCHNHKTHGDKAYSCTKTDTCPMAKTLAPKPEHTKKK